MQRSDDEVVRCRSDLLGAVISEVLVRREFGVPLSEEAMDELVELLDSALDPRLGAETSPPADIVWRA